MTVLRLRIDHVGLLAPAIGPLADEFRRLGFTVVGPTELTSVDDDGRQLSLGQFSAHVMFSGDYIELTAVEAPFPGHHLEQFLDAPWGLRLLLPACDDLEAAHERCSTAGARPAAIQSASRALSYRPGAEAHFRWFGLPATDWPDVLLAWVEHQTPDLVFDESVSTHANGACGLTRLIYIGDRLPDRYRVLDTGGPHTIEVFTREQARQLLGVDVSRTTPFAGIGIAVKDVRAAAKLLHDAGVRTVSSDLGLVVQLESGNCIIFEPES